MSERANKMAALFDIDVDSSLEESSDYDVKAKDSDRAESFADKVKTAQAIMEPEPITDETEPVTETEPALVTEMTPIGQESYEENELDSEPVVLDSNELLLDAIKAADNATELDIPDSPVTAKTELDKPMTIATEVFVFTTPVVEETESLALEPKFEADVEIQEKAPEKTPETQPEQISNPLGLIGEDWRFYQKLATDYPQFVLYNGQPAYQEFYRYKIQVLKSILTEFPIQDFELKRKEVREVNCNHTVGQTASGEIIRARLDECYRSRIRVAQLMAETYEQFFVWQKQMELLESKLWADHESRGAHKRQALVLAHMHYESLYVERMQGFLQSAKIIDGLLMAASESLSRQLACIQLKEPSSVDHTYRLEQQQEQMDRLVHSKPKQDDPQMDQLDGISEGSVISAPERNRAPRVVDSLGKFNPDDELMNLT